MQNIDVTAFFNQHPDGAVVLSCGKGAFWVNMQGMLEGLDKLDKEVSHV